MDVFVYGADIYCSKCGQAIRDRLTAQGKAPDNPAAESTYNSDRFPKGPYPDGGGEADSPQHCGACHMPLENALTAAGVRYALEYLQGAKARTAILDGWAAQLRDYGLQADQRATLKRYNKLPAPAAR